MICISQKQRNTNNILQDSLISTCSGTVDQGVSAGTSIFSISHCSPDEQFLESFPKLSRHTAVNGEIDRVRDYNEEIRDQNKDIGDVVVQNFYHRARYDMKDRDNGHGDFY